MTDSKRVRRLNIGSVEVIVAMPERTAARFTRSAAYRSLLRPSARWLYRRLAARAGTPAAPDQHDPKPSVDFPAGLTDPEILDAEGRAIWKQVKDIAWYHSIDLGHGVVTPGIVDHRDQVAYYGLPPSLEGMRCLDVATYDGFWAFEMARRGAAEVVALDVARWSDCDIPNVLLDDAIRLGANRETGHGFKVAHKVLRSNVRREICNVYDLSPERLGVFDFILLSDLLLHLRDPQLALEQVYSVCDGVFLLADVFNPGLECADGLCLTEFAMRLPPAPGVSATWWSPNTTTLKRMMTVAGFEPVEELARFVLNVPGTAAINAPHKVVLRGRIPTHHSWENPVSASTHNDAVQTNVAAPLGNSRRSRTVDLAQNATDVNG